MPPAAHELSMKPFLLNADGEPFYVRFRLSTEGSVDEDLDEEMGFETWYGELLGFGDDGKATPLAHASLVLGRGVRHGANWANDLDSQSGDLAIVGEALMDRNRMIADSLWEKHAPYGADCLIIASVTVPEQYRGHRLSKRLVNAAVRRLAPDSLVALHAMPMTETQEPAAVRALQKHWRGACFVAHRGGVYVRGPMTGR